MGEEAKMMTGGLSIPTSWRKWQKRMSELPPPPTYWPPNDLRVL